MKKTFLLSILSLPALFFAQGTLEFNQVKLVTATETVPSGKVWKVESAALSLKDGIRVSPTFKINSDTIVFGYDSYESTLWENVTEIEIQVKKGYNFSCGGTFDLQCKLIGSGVNNTPIDDNFTTNITSANTNNTTYTTLATLVPTSPGNNQIDQYTFSVPEITGSNPKLIYSRYSYRFIVKLASGKSIVLLKEGETSGGCANYSLSSTRYNPITRDQTLTTNTTATTVSRPQISTEFPIWLPAGSTLERLGNVSSLSVIEFNVIP